MNRPWVSPAEVRDYTDSDKVKGRTDAQLKIDITGARVMLFSTRITNSIRIRMETLFRRKCAWRSYCWPRRML